MALGVVMVTPSTPSAGSSSSEETVAAPGISARTCARRSGAPVTTATSSIPATERMSGA